MSENCFRIYLLDGRAGREKIISVLFALTIIAAVVNGSKQFRSRPCGCGPTDSAIVCIDSEAPGVPCGMPAAGVLAWENDDEFQHALINHGISLRLAAYQIEFPDLPAGEANNMALAAGRLAGTAVMPGEVFSMNRTLGPYTAARGFQMGGSFQGAQVIETVGGGVCKVASTLFNAVILSDLPVVERHPHGMLVPYVPPAQDATVSYGSKDFRFRNDTKTPVLIWGDMAGTTLCLALYGTELPPKVIWHQEIISQQEQPTQYCHSRELEPGQSKIISPGAQGIVVKAWLTIERTDGSTEIKDMGICRYRAMPRIVERG